MSVFEIHHRTSFRYSHEVLTSYNEARLLPVDLPQQRVLAAHVEISPVTWQSSYLDYWETRVLAFEVLRPHRELIVAATSRVEVLPGSAPSAATGWDDLQGSVLTDRLAEYLSDSPATEPAPELADYAAEMAATLPPDAAARAICAHLHDTIRYVPGSTTVHTPAAHAWR